MLYCFGCIGVKGQHAAPVKNCPLVGREQSDEVDRQDGAFTTDERTHGRARPVVGLGLGG